MAKIKSKYVCQQCGYVSPKWMGKCPGCMAWNTLVEEREVKRRGTATAVLRRRIFPAADS